MLVNYAREAGRLERQKIGAKDFLQQAEQLRKDGLEVPAGLVLALRSSEFLTALGEPELGPESDWPQPSESERIRLARKGRTLFEHCLGEASHVCVTGFLDYELNRTPTGAGFLQGFIAWMLEERPSYAEPEAFLIIDQMIDFGLSLLYPTESGPIDLDLPST